MSGWGTVMVNGESVKMNWLGEEDYKILAAQAAAEKPKPAAGFTRADQVQIKPVDWLIENWIARDSLAGIVGKSGSCKSFLAVDWACRVATGTPWQGNAVKRGAVFILAGEGRNGLRKRIEGWSAHNKVPIEGAPLYLATQLPRLDHITTAALMEEVDALAEETFFENGGADPALIIVDTLARAMAGDENSSKDMGLMIECADWLRERYPGCVVALVHHSGHGPENRARGSSAFYAALDSEVQLKPLKSGDVQLWASKAKDWQLARPMQFRRHKVEITVPGADEPTSTLVLASTAMETPKDRTAEVAELRAQKKSIREISEATGIPKSTVSRLLKDDKQEVPVWEQEFGE